MALEPLDNGPFLIFLEASGTKRHSMIEFHPVSDHAGLPDDDTCTMVDEEMRADCGTWVDIDTGTAVGPFGHHPREEGNLLLVEQMRDALNGYGLESRISQNDFLETPGGRIARVGGLDIGLEQGAHRGDPYKETLSNRRCIGTKMVLAPRFLADSEAHSDCRFKLKGDLVNDFLSCFRKFLRGDCFIGEEAWEEQM